MPNDDEGPGGLVGLIMNLSGVNTNSYTLERLATNRMK